MKKYASIFELATELDAQGFTRGKDIFIWSDGPDDSSIHCQDGTLYCYPDYKTYYLYEK